MKNYLLQQCKKHQINYRPDMKIRLLCYLFYVNFWSYLKKTTEKFDRFLEYSPVFRHFGRLGDPFTKK